MKHQAAVYAPEEKKPKLKKSWLHTHSVTDVGIFIASAALLCFVAFLSGKGATGTSVMFALVPLWIAIHCRPAAFFPILALGSMGPLLTLLFLNHPATPAEILSHLALGVVTFLISMQIVRNFDLVRTEARSDGLTGVLNRLGLYDLGVKSLERCYSRNLSYSILALDVDDFKGINDTLGHSAGDTVLRIVGGVIAEARAMGGIPGRMGGDEFVVLLPEFSFERAEAIGDSVLRECRRRLKLAGFEVTVSIGCASFDHAPSQLSKVLDAGDVQLYESKRLGKRRVRVARVAS